MARYDIAIIGTGPAGVSAAITSVIRNKSVLLLGSADLSAKLKKAHEIRNYPGFAAVSGETLGAAFAEHLSSMGIEITEDKITSVYAMGDYFALQASSGLMYEAAAVILATGVIAGKPLEGEEELLGRGVSYCATCDAPLYRGKEVTVIGYSPKEEKEAAFLSEVTAKVTYIPMYKEEPQLPGSVVIVKDRAMGIGIQDGRRVVKTAGEPIVTDGVFVLRESVSAGQLVPGLATDGTHVLVDLQMKTNIEGCFACGDIAGRPYQYVKAAGQGNVAALSAVDYLDAKKRN